MDFRATAGFAESAVAVAADFFELVWYDGSCHGHNRGTCCGDCRGISRTSLVIAAYRKIAVASAADGRGWRWKWPRQFPGNRRGNNRGFTSVAATGTTDFAQNRGTYSHNRGICRGRSMSRGTCHGNPRVSTLARVNTHGSPRKFRGHCCGPPLKRQVNVHPWTTPPKPEKRLEQQ